MPRLWRLLDPHRHAADAARDRPAPRDHRVHVGYRLRGPLPVLHEHLRDALDPRSCAGGRNRTGHGPPRPRRLGRRRRRRHVVDRRQPPDPRDAAQRRTSRSCCSTTRSTGSPRASTRRRSEVGKVTKSTPMGSLDEPFNPVRSHSAPRRRSWPAPTTWIASTCRRCSVGPTITRVRRWSRSSRTATSSTTAPSRRSPRRTSATRCSSISSTASRCASAPTASRRGARPHGGVQDRRGRRRRRGRHHRPRRDDAAIRASRSLCRDCRAGPTSRRRSGSSAPSTGPSTPARSPPAAGGAQQQKGPRRPPCAPALPADLDGQLSAGTRPGCSTSTASSGSVTSRSPELPTPWPSRQRTGASMLFVTNMTRLTVGEQEAKLARHGIDADGRVVTSAMAAATWCDAGRAGARRRRPRRRRGARGPRGRDRRPPDARVTWWSSGWIPRSTTTR